ncbi:MAG: response regulator [Proteobacteria bacterium]|nr:response regulator [Pseudomonadota bacterium]MBU4295813.1 response regulator [Pseudomonadota bacterium]MCG2747837.1 response regulator [Desulfobulbaceae bacterium]
MSAENDKQSPRLMNFLIVDDQDNMRRSVRAMLKLINYGKELFEAPNGREAWKLLTTNEAKKIDFIIADYAMPFMKGTELLSRIRSHKKLRDIPFLMITAEANKEVVAEAAEHDVDAYLTKPFVTASLEHKIDELLAKAHNPDPLTLYLLQARDLEEQGDISGAIEEVKKASSANPRSSRPFRELGRLMLKTNDMPNALKCFQKAIEINRLDVTSYHYLGQIFYRSGEIDKATGYFAQAMEISPRHSDRAIKFARLLAKKGNSMEMEKVLRLILKNNESDSDIQEEIAELAMDQGLFVLAIKCYRTILKDQSDNLHINKMLGIALQKNGAYNEAVLYLEKAGSKFGEDLDLLLSLAQAFLAMNMLIRADKWASIAHRLYPDNREAKKILDKCL